MKCNLINNYKNLQVIFASVLSVVSPRLIFKGAISDLKFQSLVFSNPHFFVFFLFFYIFRENFSVKTFKYNHSL